MKSTLSILVLILTGVIAFLFLFVAITQLPYAITKDSEGWGSMIYWFFAPILGLGSLLFCVIPSAVLYFRNRRQIDMISLLVSGITLLLILLSWLSVEPLRQWIVFGN